MTPTLAATDRIVLALLRDRGAQTVAALCDELGVTATAVRQRLERLAAGGLIEREEHRSGRGRPAHFYRASAAGLRALGDHQAELAGVLWRRVIAIEDPAVRNRVLEGISQDVLAAWGAATAVESSPRLDDGTAAAILPRLEEVALRLQSRNIPVQVQGGESGGLPVLRFTACPYPDLSSEGHEICSLETDMLSRMSGMPLRLSECRCHSADGACTYVPVLAGEPAAVSEISPAGDR